MKREEYMGALKSALAGFDEELVQEIVTDYEERFRVGLENGKTEEQVIAELGSIKDLVDELGEIQQGAGDGGKTAETNHTEQNQDDNGTYYSQSGTYYREKSFTDTFDSAMKKFGKVFDKVMKEAGRVIEDAAEKIEYHFEEAKRNHYYTTGEGNYTYAGREKDGDGEPSVEQSGEGSENCRKVVLDADLADVTVYAATDIRPRAVCHYYSHKTAMMYPFYTKQEGDTFSVGVRRNQETEKKSGFFQVNVFPSIEIELYLPANVVLVEARSTSGDIELNNAAPLELVLHTKSGDITANHLVSDCIRMDTMSGDIELNDTITKATVLSTMSGDCTVGHLNGVDGVASLEIKTASGDVEVTETQAENLKIHTASGDITVGSCRGEYVEASAASGDIEVTGSYKKYVVKSQSGEVLVESNHDADVIANSTSGDVEINISGAKETYQVAMHSVSGECSSCGKTGSASNIPTRTIEAKTISGDVTINFL